MEPPPAPPISASVTPPTAVPSTTTTTTATTTTAATYPDSTSSSPRSRATDFDDTFPPTSTGKLRLLCSYGGHIVPRPHDNSLCYVGGDTRIVVVDRSATMQDLFSRLSKTLLNGRPFTLKYQLPNEDLDSLISVSTEEDLDNMVDEYDRSKPGRIRLFLFPSKPEGSSSVGSILEGSNRSEDWFLNALNGVEALQRGFSDPASVNCLLGLNDGGGNGNSSSAKEDSFEGGKLGKLGNQNQSNQDIQSVPDSPIIETTSSFGSTSSANLAPIRVHVDDGGTGGRVLEQRVGIEEQFAQMGIGVQKQMDGHGGFVMASQPTTLMPDPAVVTGVPAAAMGGGGGEFTERVISDDERSDHGGVPVGYRKQQLSQQTIWQPVTQQKQMGSGELPSPDSVSSDSSFSTAISRQKQVMYQEPVAQLSSGCNWLPQNMIDPNTCIQLQQVSETGYALHPQYEQHKQQQQQQQQQLLQQQQQQQQLLQQQQQQLLQQQQQQQQLLQQQQQQHLQQQQGQTQPQAQQYIPSGAQFVHHSPAGAVPMSNYYQMYPPQQPQHHPHQYPVYYVPAGQAQAYSLPVQHQPNPGETPNPIPSTHPPNPTIITTSSAYTQARNVAAPKPEMYRTAAGPQLVQVPSSQPQSQHQQQQQFMGYSQIHHQSQSMAPNSASNAGYAYEFSDPAHAQLYYTQPVAPTLAAQYQAVTSGSTMVLPDETNLKQQIRSSQPL